ncbi:MAG: hypothetical protein V1809_04035 [Planctomycetota bacterium]
MRIRWMLAAALMAIASAAHAGAVTVRLKGGGAITGKIVFSTGGVIVLDTAAGPISIARDAIALDETPPADPRRPVPGDPEKTSPTPPVTTLPKPLPPKPANTPPPAPPASPPAPPATPAPPPPARPSKTYAAVRSARLENASRIVSRWDELAKTYHHRRWDIWRIIFLDGKGNEVPGLCQVWLANPSGPVLLESAVPKTNDGLTYYRLEEGDSPATLRVQRNEIRVQLPDGRAFGPWVITGISGDVNETSTDTSRTSGTGVREPQAP